MTAFHARLPFGGQFGHEITAFRASFVWVVVLAVIGGQFFRLSLRFIPPTTGVVGPSRSHGEATEKGSHISSV
jgi:hypothetical protein